MKLALECPTGLLEMVQPFADFDWILGSEVLKDEGYAKFYSESSKIKYVDNSVNEEGEPLPLDKLKEVFQQVAGTYVVSPDWIGDSKQTLDALGGCIKEFGIEKVVPVLQGSDFEDTLSCLFSILALSPRQIAIPYDICSLKTENPEIMSLRRALIVSHIPADIYVHLLGFTSLEEFLWYQRRPNVTGIDTGIPILLGLTGLDILDPLEDKSKPTFNEMSKMELNQTAWTAIIRNIALLRRYLP